MKYCPNCNTEFPDDINFCSICGQVLLTKSDPGPVLPGPDAEIDADSAPATAENTDWETEGAPETETVSDPGAALGAVPEHAEETASENVEKTAAPASPQVTVTPPVAPQPSSSAKTREFDFVAALVSLIVFLIPGVNVIVPLLWALGCTHCTGRKHLARAYWVIVAFLILFVLCFFLILAVLTKGNLSFIASGFFRHPMGRS